MPLRKQYAFIMTITVYTAPNQKSRLMGKLTTHVLDVANGTPASGVSYRLFRLHQDVSTTEREILASGITNGDGRSASALLTNDQLLTGIYELEFDAARYYRDRGYDLPSPAFTEVAVIRFGVADENANYHVPLLMTPWSYSTYRGS